MSRTDLLIPGRIVISRSGHDRGRYMVLVGTDGYAVYAADGKYRTAERPKKKNIRHVVPTGGFSSRIADMLSAGMMPDPETIASELEMFRQRYQRENKER